jgi:hypothetical protein
MIRLYDRDGTVVTDVLQRLAEVFKTGAGGADAYNGLWEWKPPDGARGKPFDIEYRADQAARLKSVIEAIEEQLPPERRMSSPAEYLGNA